MTVLLQRSTDAKRSYGTILGVNSQYGEMEDYFYHYSDKFYKEVLLTTYRDAGVDPAKVAFVEAEGLGIKVYPSSCY